MTKVTTLNEKEMQIVRYALVLLKGEAIKTAAEQLVQGEKEEANDTLEILEETLKLINKLNAKQ